MAERLSDDEVKKYLGDRPYGERAYKKVSSTHLISYLLFSGSQEKLDLFITKQREHLKDFTRTTKEECLKETGCKRRKKNSKEEKLTTSPIGEQILVTRMLSQELLKNSSMTKLDLNKEDLIISGKFNRGKNFNKSIHSILQLILFPQKLSNRRML